MYYVYSFYHIPLYKVEEAESNIHAAFQPLPCSCFENLDFKFCLICFKCEKQNKGDNSHLLKLERFSGIKPQMNIIMRLWHLHVLHKTCIDALCQSLH